MTTERDEELDRRVAAAYDDVLRESVPDRLAKLVAAPAPATVVDLASERARRSAPASRPPRAEWSWVQWGGMAASLVLGVAIGWQVATRDASAGLVADRAGQLVAAGALAQALDTGLASDARARVAVHLSFLDKAGQYCRTFSADAMAGLACRDGAQWNVVTTAQASASNTGAMRQAASSLPRPVLDAVDARIAGTAFDATQERAARDRGWKK